MTNPLLTTKFFIPRTQSELVPRQHLIERLNKGLQRKLTLISALAALHSVLRKIRDFNLQLISVKQVKLDAENETLTNSEGGADAE